MKKITILILVLLLASCTYEDIQEQKDRETQILVNQMQIVENQIIIENKTVQLNENLRIIVENQQMIIDVCVLKNKRE